MKSLKVEKITRKVKAGLNETLCEQLQQVFTQIQRSPLSQGCAHPLALCLDYTESLKKSVAPDDKVYFFHKIVENGSKVAEAAASSEPGSLDTKTMQALKALVDIVEQVESDVYE